MSEIEATKIERVRKRRFIYTVRVTREWVREFACVGDSLDLRCCQIPW